MTTWNRTTLERIAAAEEAVLATDTMERLYAAVVRQRGAANELLADKDRATTEVHDALAAVTPADAQKLQALNTTDPIIKEMVVMLGPQPAQEQDQDEDSEPEM